MAEVILTEELLAEARERPLSKADLQLLVGLLLRATRNNPPEIAAAEREG